VLADRTIQGRESATWARAAVAAYRDFEADRIVEGLAEHRHARMARFLKFEQQLADRNRNIDSVDVGAWHHDIVNVHLTQPENVGEHRPFFGRKSAGDFIVGERLGKILADRTRCLEPKGLLETVDPPLMRAIAVGRYSTATVRIGTCFRRIGTLGL